MLFTIVKILSDWNELENIKLVKYSSLTAAESSIPDAVCVPKPHDETASEQPCVGDLRLRHVRPLPH